MGAARAKRIIKSIDVLLVVSNAQFLNYTREKAYLSLQLGDLSFRYHTICVIYNNGGRVLYLSSISLQEINLQRPLKGNPEGIIISITRV